MAAGSKLRQAGRALLAIAAFFLVWGAVLRFLDIGGHAFLAVKTVVWVGFAWAWAGLAEPSGPLRAIGLTRNAATGMGVGILVGGLILAASAAYAWLDMGRLPSLAGLSAWTLVTPTLEELLFRGALLALLLRFMGFWPANLLTAGGYVAAHALGWWLAGRLGSPGLALDAAALFAASLTLGWLRGRTGSLWACLLPRWAVAFAMRG